jgi:hypothetical protein
MNKTEEYMAEGGTNSPYAFATDNDYENSLPDSLVLYKNNSLSAAYSDVDFSVNGSTITIIGNRGSYNGKIEVTNAYFVCIGEAEGGNTGGDEPAPSDGATVISVADFNAAAESTDVWYKLTGTISNLKDGDLYGNFDLTDATGSVYVYGVLSEKGGEKKKFQDLVTAHGIKNGTTITIIGNRGSYNGKIEVTNAYFVSASN